MTRGGAGGSAAARPCAQGSGVSARPRTPSQPPLKQVPEKEPVFRSEARRPSELRARELRARAVTQRAPLPRPSPTRLPPKRGAARAALGETASFSCISFMMQVEYPRSQEKSYYKKLMNYRI